MAAIRPGLMLLDRGGGPLPPSNDLVGARPRDGGAGRPRPPPLPIIEASNERVGASPRRSGGARPLEEGLLDRPLAIPCILPGLIDLPRPTPRLGGAGLLCIILKSPDRVRGGGGRPPPLCCIILKSPDILRCGGPPPLIMLRSPDILRCGGPPPLIMLRSPDILRCGGPRPIVDGSNDRLAPTPRPAGAARGMSRKRYT